MDDMVCNFGELYRKAFALYGTSALWSSRAVATPTAADALAVTRTLRVEGDLRARQLAEQIEQACRAAGIPGSEFARFRDDRCS